MAIASSVRSLTESLSVGAVAGGHRQFGPNPCQPDVQTRFVGAGRQVLGSFQQCGRSRQPADSQRVSGQPDEGVDPGLRVAAGRGPGPAVPVMGPPVPAESQRTPPTGRLVVNQPRQIRAGCCITALSARRHSAQPEILRAAGHWQRPLARMVAEGGSGQGGGHRRDGINIDQYCGVESDQYRGVKSLWSPCYGQVNSGCEKQSCELAGDNRPA